MCPRFTEETPTRNLFSIFHITPGIHNDRGHLITLEIDVLKLG